MVRKCKAKLSQMEKIFLNEMTWQEVQSAIEQNKIPVIPVGSTEQHGPHLTIDTDSFLCFEVIRAVAAKFNRLVVVPPVVYGYSSHHLQFPGTISLRPFTLINLLVDICLCLAKHGFKKIFILNGHGGNKGVIATATRYAEDQMEKPIPIASATYFDFAKQQIARIRESELQGMAHAGELETSLQLFLRSNLVSKSKIQKSVLPIPINDYVYADLMKPSVVNLTVSPENSQKIARAYACSENGAAGDPTCASTKKGELFFKSIVEGVVGFLKKFDEL